ncbi:MAG: NAD(P)H-dependent flavin oxidoreductase [Clostridiaceae bacterium]
MKIPVLEIGDIKLSIPIIQGGMGVGVSLGSLAGAVSKEGGLGIISGVQIGFKEKDFYNNTLNANLRAIRKEIKKAKEISQGAPVGINLMVAMNYYEEIANCAIEEGIDVIISGAGLPINLPKLVEGKNVKIAPIVSSRKAASVILKLYARRYNIVPDFLVVEGPLAGGHLGFKKQQLSENIKLEDILKEVIEEVSIYENKFKKKIPVIAAGGIYTGDDIGEFLELNAAGVQMATRFIGTFECDASEEFKQAFIDAKKEDITIVDSPVGLPGRAIKNKFVNKEEKEVIDKCFNCLKTCNPKDTPYCISKALINSVSGDTKNGLLFTGTNGYRIDKILKVHDLIEELKKEIILH